MKQELAAAVDFLAIRLKNKPFITEEHIDLFKENLTLIMMNRYQHQWIPENPQLYSFYRCICIGEMLEPMLVRAGILSGISQECIFHAFRAQELIMFVNPYHVYCQNPPDKNKLTIFQCDPPTPESPSYSPPPPYKKRSRHCTLL